MITFLWACKISDNKSAAILPFFLYTSCILLFSVLKVYALPVDDEYNISRCIVFHFPWCSSYLEFSKFLVSVVWCILLFLENSQPLSLQICILSLFCWGGCIICMLNHLTLSQFGMFCFHSFSIYFVLFSFDSGKVRQGRKET